MKYTLKDIEEDPDFSEFLDARGITEKTRQGHITAMKGYCNYHLESPTELVEEAGKEQDAGIKRKKGKYVKKK